MQYELNQQELNIIQKALKDLLEVGITEPQENYIRTERYLKSLVQWTNNLFCQHRYVDEFKQTHSFYIAILERVGLKMFFRLRIFI